MFPAFQLGFSKPLLLGNNKASHFQANIKTSQSTPTCSSATLAVTLNPHIFSWKNSDWFCFLFYFAVELMPSDQGEDCPW